MSKISFSHILTTVTTAAGEIFERPVVATDNFFDLGGDSICAIELCGLLEERLYVEVDMSIITDSSDFAALSRALSKIQEAAASTTPN